MLQDEKNQILTTNVWLNLVSGDWREVSLKLFSTGMDGRQLGLERVRVRECSGREDTALFTLEAGHTDVQQVETNTNIINISHRLPALFLYFIEFLK